MQHWQHPQHRSSKRQEFEYFRRAGTCAALATVTTIGVFSLVASLMSNAVGSLRNAVDDGIPVMEVTVVKGKRNAVPVASADGEAWFRSKREVI